MKKFETPVLDVEKLQIMDVIATSTDMGDSCDNKGGDDEL